VDVATGRSVKAGKGGPIKLSVLVVGGSWGRRKFGDAKKEEQDARREQGF